MVNVTFSLSEDTARRLREFVRNAYGARKGSLSSFVEGAIEESLDQRNIDGSPKGYKAFRGGELVAEGENLPSLAKALRQAGIDVRGLRIESTAPLKPVVRVRGRGRRL
jgi:hypothetical protein